MPYPESRGEPGKDRKTQSASFWKVALGCSDEMCWRTQGRAEKRAGTAAGSGLERVHLAQAGAEQVEVKGLSG